ARHAGLWLLFAIPPGLFFVVESKSGVVPPLDIYESVVTAFPNSPMAHYQIGRELQEMGRLREARQHYEQALSLAPHMLPAQFYFDLLLSDIQEMIGETEQF